MAELATIATFGFPDFDPPEVLGLFHQLGCTGAQYYRNEANQPDEATIVEDCQSAGLNIDSIHGVFGSRYDPSSPDDSQREMALQTYFAEGQLSRRLGGPMVVVHPAPLLAPADPIPREHYSARREAMLSTMRLLAEEGEAQGVTYLIENLPPYVEFGSDALQLADMIRRIDSPNLRMCLDTGHAHMTGDLYETVRHCADVIDYLHIHDNDGVQDSHLMPGDGNIDWKKLGAVIAESRLDVPLMLEVFYLADDLRKCIANGRGKEICRCLGVTANA